MVIDIPTHNDFRLTGVVSLLTGSETLMLDGQTISKKTVWDFVSVHSFDRVEDERTVRYEVNFVSGYWTPGYILRRDGIVVSHS